MSQTDEQREEQEGEHPEKDRAYDRDEGGQVPDEQPYEGPDPTQDEAGDGNDEDQGV
ncbi:MAG: hypothetical protein H0U46_08130 [Actinobacteria bacterium]|nr:hypothetical protein [Actinomycetota bacterium]MBA3585429.1 hypothetical protein [Gemmatimonadota bacterium]